MTLVLPSAPPKYASPAEAKSPIRLGESGWRVWALQVALDADPLISMSDFGGIDASFGPGTERAVKLFQKNNFIDQVGFAGPRTQLTLLNRAETDAQLRLAALPDHILLGFTIWEGGGSLAETNWYTPPGDTPGVDCGPAQLRIVGPPYSLPGLKSAFDARQAFHVAGLQLLHRKSQYFTECAKRGHPVSDQEALRLAVLAHNAPFLAEQLVRNGKLTTPNARPTSGAWALKPDGLGWYSHLEWSIEYPARILSYVVN